MKHADALKMFGHPLSQVYQHLTMIGTKKHGARFEDNLRPFSLHDASRSNFAIPIKTRHVRFQLLWLWIGNEDGMSWMWIMFFWTFTTT